MPQFRYKVDMRRLFLALILGVVFVSACTPATEPLITPISPVTEELLTEAPPSLLTAKLDVRIDPENAGQFILNPTPLGESGYSLGMPVRIDVIPQEGWLLDSWVGPVFDKAGNTANIKMTSSMSVVIKMKSTKPMPADTPIPQDPTHTPVPQDPTHTPVPPPPAIITYEEIEWGGDSIFLEPAGCNNEHFESVTLQKGDKVELSVTRADREVTIVVQSPQTGRKTVGRSGTSHWIFYDAMADGKYRLIIVGGGHMRSSLPCNKQGAHTEYEYVISRPSTK
jgi:hypothetical protein